MAYRDARIVGWTESEIVFAHTGIKGSETFYHSKRYPTDMSYENQIAMMEHLALAAPLTLRAFCDHCRQLLSLPEFRFDSENETEWGVVVKQGVEYNISCPYQMDTLQQWDDTVPDGCNFGISLCLYQGHFNAKNHEWAYNQLVSPVAQKIADGFQVPVHYHRTWLGAGKNQSRNETFYPHVN
ncbi:hypothetical protein Enr10x_60460 [Gimesia panareensis]|uniref:Uncharacterized protein n=1 Tax=Gimesia panareensis TaxID=2527978 RepID=A0A517QGA7_9PLAN|nr:hypothetical protein [Gimesia panareensis]QDT30678.1 hypothetical protein Enr10x_60460 [Gimesia panareensis]